MAESARGAVIQFLIIRLIKRGYLGVPGVSSGGGGGREGARDGGAFRLHGSRCILCAWINTLTLIHKIAL